MGLVFAALVVAATSALALDQLNWTDYRYPEQAFSIQFPGAPKVTHKAVEGRTPLTQHEYQFGANRKIYDVAVIEFTDGHGRDKPSTAYLASLIASYAKGSGSSLRTQSVVAVAGQPGLEAVTEDEPRDRYHLVDVLAVGTRVYLIVSEGPKGHDASAEAKRFRDSFRLIGR